MGPTLILAVAMALPMGGGHGHHIAHQPACQTCNPCDTCSDGCLHKGGFWARHGLPSPHRAPGNMGPHIPYETANMRYYYFRPYNYMHIPIQQAEAVSVGIPASLPYSNSIFQRVYAEIEAGVIPEAVPAPMQPQAPPAPPVPDSPLDTPAPQPPVGSSAAVTTPQTLIP